MRYAEYGSAGRSAATGVVLDTRPERRAVDLIREAARNDRYWVLLPEADGKWTLRQLDGTTGLLGEAMHVSEPIGPDAGLGWAADLVDVSGWTSMSRPYPGAFIDELYGLVRDLARTPRPGRGVVLRVEADPSFPGLKLLTVRERWAANDLESDPIYSCEYIGFADETDLLERVSGWFGLDPAGWTTVTPGVEYRHG